MRGPRLLRLPGLSRPTERQCGSVNLLALVLVCLLIVLAGCGGNRPTRTSVGTAPGQAVVVASFNFTESEVLAEIYSLALEHAGIPVHRELDLGPRELVQPALIQDLVDVIPEYSGTALSTLAPASSVNPGNAAAVLNSLRDALRPLHLSALHPSAAQDQNAFIVTRAVAVRLKLHTLTDLARVAGTLTLGGPAECPKRPYCAVGLQRVYGIRFARYLPFDDTDQRMQALDQGVIDVAVSFTTDGRLAQGDLVMLADNRHLQPVEQVTPIVSDRAVTQYGDRLRAALDAVSRGLDSASLRLLNWRVDVERKPIADEARAWLVRLGLLPR